jgi:hypothetical protein
MPEVTASVSVPRIVAVEHPFGMLMGQPGDSQGQMALLRSVFASLETMRMPGSIDHVPATVPDSFDLARAHPPEPPPLTQHLTRHPLQFRNLLKRDIPK